MCRFRTVQTEHPRSWAVSDTVSGSPKWSSHGRCRTGFPSGSSARGRSAQTPLDCCASAFSRNLTSVNLTPVFAPMSSASGVFATTCCLASIAMVLSLKCPMDCRAEPVREHAPEEPENSEQQSNGDQSVLYFAPQECRD